MVEGEIERETPTDKQTVHVDAPSSVTVMSGAGAQAPVVVEKNGRDILILRTLAIVLVVFALGTVGIGVLSMIHVAIDPGGVNAVREDMKSSITYILGVFSGIVTAKTMAQLQHNGGAGKP